MERRSFLALLASAPIAALAPWPAVLERYAVGGAFTIALPLPHPLSPPGISFRYIKQWDIVADVTSD